MRKPSNTSLAIGLLLLHAILLAWSGYRHSPTIDEPAHLAAGISHWKFGRFDLYSVNPPLVRMVAALPVLAANPETRWGEFRAAEEIRAEFEVGEAFADANGKRIFRLITWARWACIPFSLLGGWFCFLWAKELFGGASGLLALSLWCFSPTILGNGSLITADVPAAALCVTAVYFFRKWLQYPQWPQAIMVGTTLGLALLTKSSLILLCGLLPVIWLLIRTMESRRSTNGSMRAVGGGVGKSILREASQLVAQVALAILVLNLGYGFEGTGQTLNAYEFRSEALGAENHGRTSVERGNRFADSLLGYVPVPLPKNYVLGIDHQKRDFETGLRNYLLGEIRTDGEGWWWFYAFAALVKVPLGTWLLALLAIPTALRGEVKEQLLLLIPAAFYFVLVSSQYGLNFFRYLLPVFPLMFIWISQVVQEPFRFRDSRVRFSVCIAALSWSIASSLYYFPHSLAYFNVLAGGPENGYRIMVDSNLDWGQDLIYLKEWMAENPSAHGMNLSYYGPMDPIIAGLDVYVDGTRAPQRGDDKAADGQRDRPQWFGISATKLGHQAAMHKQTPRSGGGHSISRYEKLYDRKPDARIGYSIHLYRLDDNEVQSPRD